MHILNRLELLFFVVKTCRACIFGKLMFWIVRILFHAVHFEIKMVTFHQSVVDKRTKNEVNQQTVSDLFQSHLTSMLLSCAHFVRWTLWSLNHRWGKFLDLLLKSTFHSQFLPVKSQFLLLVVLHISKVHFMTRIFSFNNASSLPV